MTVTNPILPGFHPDPSLCRAGGTYYIATSTFEWYPGVSIHASTDLKEWKLAARPLDRPDLLDMRGNPWSGGIWAPSLSFDSGLFWLVYTDVKGWEGSVPDTNDGFKDTPNYLTTAESIEGPWSTPVFLNAAGFDPSLFHDRDGRKWLLNVLWDYRPVRNHFSGISIQEYDASAGKLVGKSRIIYRGTDMGFTEGPTLTWRNGFYHLMVAEGGTSYAHALTVARSRSLMGPYETSPDTPLLSSSYDPVRFLEEWRKNGFETARGKYLKPGLQKAGHGNMIPLTQSVWLLAHLCARPLSDGYHCPLGRETGLQLVYWEDDWPHTAEGSPRTLIELPRDVMPEISEKEQEQAPALWREDFNGPGWDRELLTLRSFTPGDYDLDSRSGWIGLIGRQSPTSAFSQTMLMRRVVSFSWRTTTTVDFQPGSFQQMAGLLVRYHEKNQAYACVTDVDGKRVLSLLSYDSGTLTLPLDGKEPVLPPGPISLGVEMRDEMVYFSWQDSLSGLWNVLEPCFPAARFSDEGSHPMGFTGMFVGIACHDVSGMGTPAFFDCLSYEDRD